MGVTQSQQVKKYFVFENLAKAIWLALQTYRGWLRSSMVNDKAMDIAGTVKYGYKEAWRTTSLALL